MIAETIPLQTSFLRLKPSEWQRPHLDPLPPIQREIMNMVSRVISCGWGPSDPQKGLRLSIPLSPTRMSRHGGRKSRQKYSQAISALIEKKLLLVTGTDSRGVRHVKPSQLWINRGQGDSQGDGQGSHKINKTIDLSSVQKGTYGRSKKTEAPKVPSVVSKPPKKGKNPPLRFREGTPTEKQSEFLGLVRICYQKHGRDAYAVANSQLRNHRLEFLLPIWREATSQTSGVQTPLAWIKTVTRRKGGA